MRTSLILLQCGLTVVLAACSGGGVIDTQVPDDDSGTTTGAGNLSLSPSTLEFDALPFGSSDTMLVTLRNTGTAGLTVTDMQLEGPYTLSFAGNIQLSAGSSTTITVIYKPDDYEEDPSTLYVTSDDPDEPEQTLTVYGSVITDSDGDGYDSEEAGGRDCDDSDASVNPDAEDAYYDGEDSNCDGADDYDQDGDGYQAESHNDDPDAGGGDCIDSNASVYPGAADTWYDGVDSDCDGSNDYDQDGDGEKAEPWGDDCDDLNDAVNSDMEERLNGVDDDCDGEIDRDVAGASADVTIEGTASNDTAGWALTMGDLDADGSDDLIVGAYSYSSGRGHVSIFAGGSMPLDGASIEDGVNDFRGSSTSDNLGYELAYLSSWSDDGAALAVGAPGADGGRGEVYILPGEDLTTTADTGDALLTISNSSLGYRLGRGLAEDLDLDGDGHTDLFGYFTGNSAGTTGPYLFLQYGDTTGEIELTDTDARWAADGSNNTGFRSMPSGGDMDGDGYQDAVFCDGRSSHGATSGGAVYVLFGKANSFSVSETTASFEDNASVAVIGTANQRVGYVCGVGEDVDGDDDNEIWLYAQGDSAVMMIPGDNDFRSGNLDASDAATVTYTHGSSSDPDFYSLSLIGDWTGDGVSEVALGGESSSTVVAGSVFVFSSELTSGDYDAEEAALGLAGGDGDDGNAHFGDALSSRPGDLDGDGKTELVVGDYGWGDPTKTYVNQGAVFITVLGD